jgi:hypothetical protein
LGFCVFKSFYLKYAIIYLQSKFKIKIMKNLSIMLLSVLLALILPLNLQAATTGKVLVIKQVINIHGQTKQSSDFTITGTAFGGFLLPYIDTYSINFPGSASGTLTKIGPGTYSFVETTDPAYNVSYSPDCSGTIAANDNKTCVIINSDIGADVTVKVNVSNTNGGNKSASDFTVNFAATNGIISPVPDPASISFLGSSVGTIVGLNAGAYSVNLNPITGYNFTYSSECTGNAGNPSSAVCTVTAQDIAGVFGGGGGGGGGSGSGSGGSGGGGGGGLPVAPSPTPSSVGLVNGAFTNTPNAPTSGTADPKVLGAVTELPRTGLPFALVFIPSVLAALAVLKKRKV